MTLGEASRPSAKPRRPSARPRRSSAEAVLKRFAGTMKGLNFETSDATIANSQPALEEAARTLERYPGIRVEIIGHTDDQGDREANIDLSRRRAEAVAQALIELGIAAERLSTSGRGPDEPLERNDTPEGRAQNRRIEFRVLDDREL